MIVWVNGAFGVGKTTVARELVVLLPGARLVDPERIGYVVRRTFWRGVDYQDVALWRRLVRWQVAWRGRSGVAIVPMTLLGGASYAELTRGARVFLLTATTGTIEDRISGSDEAQAWRRQNLARCLAAFERGGLGTPVETDGLTSAAVARSIVDLL